jgi:hypothetical protein
MALKWCIPQSSTCRIHSTQSFLDCARITMGCGGTTPGISFESLSPTHTLQIHTIDVNKSQQYPPNCLARRTHKLLHPTLRAAYDKQLCAHVAPPPTMSVATTIVVRYVVVREVGVGFAVIVNILWNLVGSGTEVRIPSDFVLVMSCAWLALTNSTSTKTSETRVGRCMLVLAMLLDDLIIASINTSVFEAIGTLDSRLCQRMHRHTPEAPHVFGGVEYW